MKKPTGKGAGGKAAGGTARPKAAKPPRAAGAARAARAPTGTGSTAGADGAGAKGLTLVSDRPGQADAKADATAGGTAAELRKKTLVERVAEVSGVKKKDARAVVDAALAEIGAALSRGEALNLPPLGKAKVNRHKEKGSGEVLVLKLRRGGKDDGQEGLADADD